MGWGGILWGAGNPKAIAEALTFVPNGALRREMEVVVPSNEAMREAA